jgi:hypothetical protein
MAYSFSWVQRPVGRQIEFLSNTSTGRVAEGKFAIAPQLRKMAGNSTAIWKRIPCTIARLRGCAVARLRGCAVARLRGSALNKRHQIFLILSSVALFNSTEGRTGVNTFLSFFGLKLRSQKSPQKERRKRHNPSNHPPIQCDALRHFLL